MAKEDHDWDIKCPRCGIGGGEHCDHDYSTEFDVMCENCGSEYTVSVEVVPWFNMTETKAPEDVPDA